MTAQALLERTVAVLFPQQDGPTVVVYAIDDDIHAVGAYRVDRRHGCASIITVQAHNTVRSRSAVQQLLSETMRNCAEARVASVVTDVRARGFLRREGFSPAAENDVAEASRDDAAVTYQRLLSADPNSARESSDDSAASDAWRGREPSQQ